MTLPRKTEGEMQDDLIFDVGAHKGEDTAFYLSKGFRVVAIEANPSFCELIGLRFKEAISSGVLKVLNIAIAQRAGTIDFFVNEDISVWGTTKPEWVERNRRLSAGRISQIQVKCAPLSKVVEQYGVPHYCKIDIEGNDVEALASLAEGESPEFISIESEKLSWNDLLGEFRLLQLLGYRKFKIIDQSLISFQHCPSPAREGKYVDHRFDDGSSGLFGNELPGHWLSNLEAIEVYKSIFRGYAINGDAGLFVGGKRSLFNTIGEIQQRLFRFKGILGYANPARTFPPAGWYDTHASK